MAKISRPVEYKDIAADAMQATGEGIVTGYLSTFNNIDEGNDRVLPGAFAVSIKDARARRAASNGQIQYLWPALWNHSLDSLPVGGVTEAREDSRGLLVKIEMNLDTTLGRECYASLRNGHLSAMSMGYRAIRSDFEHVENKTVRNLRECALVESTFCVFPMNTQALVQSVKSREGYNTMLARTKDFSSRFAAETLDDWQFSDWGDLTTALKLAVMDCFTAGSDPASTLESDVIPQFIAALRQYVSEGVSLGFTGDSSSGMDMGMMSMSGAGMSQKSGYLNANDHTAIKESSTMIMKHAKIIASASARVENAHARARAGQLAGWPVYGSMSDTSIFEEKQDEQDAQEMIGLLAGSLEVQNSLRELKELRESTITENPLVSGVDLALQRFLSATEHKGRK